MLIGEIAHIAGRSPGSPRYDDNMSPEERNEYANLIFLCPTCHTEIDKDPKSHTVETLKILKDKHEASVEQAIKESTLELTFFELEATLRHLMLHDAEELEETLRIIPPKDKIKKNNLSAKTEGLLRVGLLQSNQVGEYLNKHVDMRYEEKIRQSFVTHYGRIKATGESGDEVFFTLLDIASNGNSDSKKVAAGLSILAYYFQLCEVFEK